MQILVVSLLSSVIKLQVHQVHNYKVIMPRKLIYIPLKTLPQEATLDHIFKVYAALRIAIKEEGLYVMFQDAAVSEQFTRHLKEGRFADLENNCVEILGEEDDWRNSMEDSLLQLTSQDLLNYTDFLSNRQKQMYSITSSPQQDSLHSSVKSEEVQPEFGLPQVSNIITIYNENEGGNTIQNEGDQIGLFEVPLGQETVCIQLQFQPESESKKSFLSSSEDQNKTSIICYDKLSEQKMTSNNQATKEELKDFEEKAYEEEEHMTEALTFEEEQFMRMNGQIGHSISENCPQSVEEQSKENEDSSKDKTTDHEAVCTMIQNAVI